MIAVNYSNPTNITVDTLANGMRWYSNGEGIGGPSVTTVISLSPAGVNRWPASAAANVAYARDRGLELHHANALYAGAVPGMTLDWDSLDPDVRPRMEAIVDWKKKVGWESTEFVERPFFDSRYRFGGCPDEVGRALRLGFGSARLTILDFKPLDAPLVGPQLSGYALLVKNALDLPYVPGRIALRIGDGVAIEQELRDHARDRDAFLAALCWFNFGHEQKLW